MSVVVLRSGSLAEDGGFVALADVAEVARGVNYRLIGDHMVQLLAARWNLDAELFRLTGDADLGVPPIAVQKPTLVDALLDRGYERSDGNRFGRTLATGSSGPNASAGARAVVDVLVPAYSSRTRSNVRFADHLVTTEVPGLAFALRREPVVLSLELHRLGGEVFEIDVTVPDEVSALALKTLATTVRQKSTDFSDIWRCLEICFAAGLGPDSFSDHDDIVRSVELVTSLFADLDGVGMRMVVEDRRLNEQAAAALHTRIRALSARLFGK
ncbi:MAG: hypothetical protein CL424_04370 [Acidimicrobiaceae bacterium]|nr:hypothetical protein [Acidimicrobiaceae bacterium]